MVAREEHERRTLWIYPWDILDAGIEETVRRARDEWGITSLGLASSYHSAKFLLPRRSERKVYLNEGSAVYFQPDDSAYTGPNLRPIVTQRSDLLDVLDRTIDACHSAGIELRAWTVGLHNSRLGEAHPELSQENVFGDRYPWALCPSNPEVRSYLVGLVHDLVSNHDLDGIDLESAGFHGLYHGHHHEVIGINYGPIEETLMSLCFCKHCRKRAADAGVDTDRLRSELRQLLETRFREEAAMSVPDATDMRPILSLLLSWPDLHGFLQARLATVTALIEEVRHSALAGSNASLAVAAATFVKPASNAWLEGMDLRAVARIADEVILVSYFHDPSSVAADIQFGRELTGSVEKLTVGFSLLAPLTSSAANLQGKVAAARAMGVSRLSFYNFGFVSEARLNWLSSLV